MGRFGRWLISSHLSRYSLVGGAIAVLYFGTVLILVEFTPFATALSIGCAYIVAAVTRFVLHRFWVFEALNGKFHRQVGRYVLTLVLAYVLNVATTELLIQVVLLQARYAVVIATIVVTLLAYYVSSRWVFN